MRASATSALAFGVPVEDPLDDMHQAPHNDSTRPASTRRELANTRRQTTRKRYLAATAVVAVAGSLVGTGFIVQSNAASAERAAATAQLSSGTGLQHEQLGVYATIAKAQTDQKAKATIDDANQVIAAVQNKVDTTPLSTTVASLASYQKLDRDTVLSLMKKATEAKANVQAAASQADQAAADAAAAAEAAAAEALAAGNTVAGAKATAQSLAASKYGWGDDQFSCLVSLWTKESGWNYQAQNSSSGAAGIPQALPGSKMASAGSDWETNATTQVTWGLDYIKRGYGTPCAAWSHSQSVNWY
ncbi:hypothetical protein ITJ38_06030 [Agreia pratensis]|uniref:aggregation-promoting factor C-terminal-like domain-containing protein n=1 Tax=Agreia pratensis TaxID=150121 RepID=UPI00188A4DC5|nr:hypothetical protein [Agreia pratensis]MBF4633957.1 hypothetical protein [Agreia pratensis]